MMLTNALLIIIFIALLSILSQLVHIHVILKVRLQNIQEDTRTTNYLLNKSN
jgi:hypothetical protein